MGTWAEYEEKEFETLANAAFVLAQKTARWPRLYSPGQVLEKSLGFDFATRVDPAGPLYRSLFGGVPGVPGAVAGVGPLAGVPVAPPTRSLNVFLQYKRPQYFSPKHRSSTWPRNEEHLGFTVGEGSRRNPDFTQLQSLIRLENQLSSQALVRYVCPAHWRKSELYDAFVSGDLLRKTTFVRPQKLYHGGALHWRWLFDPKNLGAGRPNPEGDEEIVEAGEIFSSIIDRGVGTDVPGLAVSQLIASTAAELGPVQQLIETREVWFEEQRYRDAAQAELEAAGEIHEADRVIVDQALLIAQVARALRVAWLVAVDR